MKCATSLAAVWRLFQCILCVSVDSSAACTRTNTHRWARAAARCPGAQFVHEVWSWDVWDKDTSEWRLQSQVHVVAL